MRRSVLLWVCVGASLALPVVGCSDESAGGGGGSRGDVFPCTEPGILAAIARGGGPHTFSCDGSTTITTEAEIEIDNDVILDGGGNLAVDGDDTHRVFSVAEGVTVDLRGFTVTGGSEGPGPKTIRSGAGIHNSGTLTLAGSTVSGNAIGWGSGGGIHNRGMLTVAQTTVSGNSTSAPGSVGGGISNDGTLSLVNSTVSGNASGFDGSCHGRGISNEGTLTLMNSTVSGNASDLVDSCDGGGISNDGTLVMRHSVVDGDCEGDITSNGYNIESPGNTCGFNQQGDEANVTEGELNLGSLQDNGGPTETHALLPGSVAIDVIPEAMCELAQDQRGMARPQDSPCDVGAFERQPDD